LKRNVKSAQKVSRMCLVCGVDNEAGLRARFFVLENGELVGLFVPRPEHQSYPGRLHGGIVSAILDETIGRAVNVSDTHAWGVTVEFKVKFRSPVPLDREVKVVARITRDSSRLFEGTGEILLEDGTVAAEAHGRYLKMPLESIASVQFGDSDWFADDRLVPREIDVPSAPTPTVGTRRDVMLRRPASERPARPVPLPICPTW
jgi:acyl-coenzyme A thioesterase PaaI-like protein